MRLQIERVRHLLTQFGLSDVPPLQRFIFGINKSGRLMRGSAPRSLTNGCVSFELCQCETDEAVQPEQGRRSTRRGLPDSRSNKGWLGGGKFHGK
jgi:hypothetical protein